MTPCEKHPEIPATWQCGDCHRCFCDQCIQVKQFGNSRVQACANCGYICDPLTRDLGEEGHIETTLLTAFSYPLQGMGWAALAGGTIALTVLDFLLGPIGAGIGWALLCAYSIEIVRESAEGKEELPDWADITHLGDLAPPTVMALGTMAASFLPAFLVYSAAGNGLPFWAAVIGGAAYAPMAWLAVAMHSNVFLANPITVITSISRVGSAYLIACGILLLIAGAFLLSVGVVGAISSGIAAGAVANAIMLYFFFVENRVLGLLYLSHERALGWFSAGKR